MPSAPSSRAFSPTEEILESISDGVFTVDLDWRITSFNRAAEVITGIPRQKAIGRSCRSVFRSTLCGEACPLRLTLETGKPVINHPCHIVAGKDKPIPISVSTAVLRNQQGVVIGGAETFRDLSEVAALRKELKHQFSLGDLVSRSPLMRRAFDLAEAVVESSSTVLIHGETGTGKELMARAIHQAGSRADQPFVAVNCGALPDPLLESELFGYKRGAFTDATRDKPGRFTLAGKGTIFLDEIGEISPALQIRLLRVLQEQTFEPLGGTTSERNRARVITATNRDLAAMVRKGSFREDLFYRIHVIAIELPPLRRRKEDIPLLIEHFVEQLNHLNHRCIPGPSLETQSLLLAHDWPGNVRELQNIIERAFILCQDGPIEPRHLPENFSGAICPFCNAKDITTTRRVAEEHSIMEALRRNRFHRLATARDLGIHKTTLYRKLKSLGIALPPESGRRHPRT